MARGWLVGAVILLLAASVAAPTESRPAAAASFAKKKCHYVTKKVHGKKKRVRVCTTVKKPTSKPTFTAAPTNTPTPTATATQSSPTLSKLAAARGIIVGGLGEKYFDQNPEYAGLLASEFNGMIIADDAWASPDPADGVPDFSPDANTFNWGQIDPDLEFARAHHLAVQVSGVVSTRYDMLPGWLKNGNYTQDQLRSILTSHVTTVIDHLKAYADLNMEIGLVVEPGVTGYDFWYDHLGDGYLDLIYRTAREAWPQATLYMDDWGNYTPSGGRFAADLAIVKRLRGESVTIGDRSYPLIDEIGMEPIVDASQPMPSLSDFLAAQKAFVDAGVRITVTGAEVDLSKATDATKYQVEAEYEKALFDALVKNGYSKTFYIWGLIDGSPYCFPPGGESCLFDAKYAPKPNYFALRDEIASLPTT